MLRPDWLHGSAAFVFSKPRENRVQNKSFYRVGVCVGVAGARKRRPRLVTANFFDIR
jgi:hypothetical protein